MIKKMLKPKPDVLKIKRREKKEYVPYEFASKSPEPCLIDSSSKESKDTNRLIEEYENNMSFLVSNFQYLNVHALRLLADLTWVAFYKVASTNVDRVSPASPWFGQHYYKVRFCGYHGVKVVPVYLITKEDDSERYVILGIQNESCDKCGKIDCLFKIKPNSPNTRCSGCRNLPGVRNGL